MNGMSKLRYGRRAFVREAVEDNDEACDEGDCCLCSGPLVPLGTLGNLQHFRCRNCGMDQSRKVAR
jgi:hypothetical protein